MRLLLDTHALLWWWNPSRLLSARARDAISDETTTVLVSAVSAFEIATKHRIGKLPGVERLLANFAEELTKDDFGLVPITLAQAIAGGQLDIPHRDPFDRLLIAQAQIEDADLVSNETLFDQFGVRRLW